jgi:hypothetical protein
MHAVDYRFMLESAKEHLDELPILYNSCLREKDVPKRLTNKIRYFLNDIESALDYIAFKIFNNYCLKHINDPNKIESKKKQVNFPLYDTKDWFDKKIDKIFLELRSERPDIIEIFESRQPFVKGKDDWLPTFNRLVNTNKHRELEKQQRNQKTHVFNGQIGGITMRNVTFENVGTPIVYNGLPINFLDPSPFNANFNFKTTIEFVFKPLGLPVLPTLLKIYGGAKSTIDELEYTMERD